MNHFQKRLCFSSAFVFVCASLWATYLFWPYRENLHTWQFLLPLNTILGSVGMCCLAQRWVFTRTGILVTSLMYGMGPLAFYFMRFHPTAGTLVALIPWCCCPAAYLPVRLTKSAWGRRCWEWLLLLVPLAAIIGFSLLSVSYRRFAVPLYVGVLHGQDGLGLLVPLLRAEQGAPLLGFFHMGIGIAVMGGGMLIKARRASVLLPCVLGTVLACMQPLYGISPLLWWTLAHVIGAIMVGMGFDGITHTGRTDARWLLAIGLFYVLLAVSLFLIPQWSDTDILGWSMVSKGLLRTSVQLYCLGAVTLGLLWLAALYEWRVAWLRTWILLAAVAIDVVVTSRLILVL